MSAGLPVEAWVGAEPDRRHAVDIYDIYGVRVLGVIDGSLQRRFTGQDLLRS